MGTSSSSGGITKIRRRSTTTGKFTKQLLTITLRNGRRMFSSRGRDLTTNQMLDEVFEEFRNSSLADFQEGFRLGVVKAAEAILLQYIPMVALKTGNLRNAILNLAYMLKNNLTAELLNQNILIFSSVSISPDFQTGVWSILNYAIYHAVEFRKLDFYVDPTTKGTAPYSTILFFQLVEEIIWTEVYDYTERMGWDVEELLTIGRQIMIGEL